jgi:predicted NUDIX family NTP pyrophosphohydrolase
MGVHVSAGLLMYRIQEGSLQIFLAHPGGPLYRNKDNGHWTVPKGEMPAGESLFDAAVREFEEETGIQPCGPFIELGSIQQKGGKVIHCWAFQGSRDRSQPIRSNHFEMEWPPRSGCRQSFPEIDRAEFFALSEGRKKLKDAQWPFVERLTTSLVNHGLIRRPSCEYC